MKILKKIETVFFVKGYNRGIIFDFQRDDYDFVPNSLIDFVNTYDKKVLSSEIEEEFVDYISFLIEKEYCFFCDEFDFNLFQKVSLEYEEYSKIQNAFVELDNSFNIIFLNKLVQLGCSYFLFIVNKNAAFDLEKLTELIDHLNNQLVDSVIFYFEDSKSYNLLDLNNLINNYNIISKVVFFSQNQSAVDDTILEFEKILFLSQDFEVSEHSKSPYNFNWSFKHYLEAQNFNTYFNKKIFINSKGDISNTYFFENSFLNIGNSTYEEIVDFLNDKKNWELWYVSKDDILICKDCEFRYICNDVQIPVKLTNNKWKMNKECNYNPLISKWNNENGYRSIIFFGSFQNNDFEINHERVLEYNKSIW